MEKAEFIQKYLIEKGVPADLTKPTAFIWSRYKDPSKSLQFFNLLQKYSLHMAYLWDLSTYFAPLRLESFWAKQTGKIGVSNTTGKVP